MSEEKKTNEQAEQVEEAEEQTEEQSRFDKYREAYLREKLSKLNIEEGAEMDVALAFVRERLDEDDSNLDEVIRQLRVRMRLDERKSYIEPTPLGGGHGRSYPLRKNVSGRKLYERATKRRRGFYYD